MNCKQVREMLSDYIDNIIEYEDAKEIEAHLAECVQCRREYEELLHLVSSLQSLPDVELPAEFDERLHEALLAVNAEREAGATVIPVTRKKSLMKRISSIAAIFVVGIFAIAMYNNSDQLMRDATNDADKDMLAVSDGALRAVEYGRSLPESEDSSTLNDISIENYDNEAQVSFSVTALNNDESAGSGASVAEDPVQKTDDGMDVENNTVDIAAYDLDPDENAGDTGEAEPADQDTNQDTDTDDGTTDSAVSRGNISAYDKLMLLYSTDGAILFGRDLTAVEFYMDLLDEMLEGVDFEILSCEKEEGIWSFEVETVSTDEEGNEVREIAIYQGQDGILWTEEQTEEL